MYASFPSNDVVKLDMKAEMMHGGKSARKKVSEPLGW